MRKNAESALAEIQKFPKIDLHRHLLGSARVETLWELSQKYNLAGGKKSLSDFKKAIVHEVQPLNLSEYIQPWKLLREVIQSPGDIKRIAFEAATDARLDGVKYVEFRSSLPGMPITDGNGPQTRIPVNDYLCAIREGFSEVSGISCRLVASVTRHAVGAASPALVHKYTDKFFEAITDFRDNLVVGVDLTGIESGWSALLFKNFFAQARTIGLPVTIHAGETEGPKEIWAALDDLGASRIGHGTSAPKDEKLIKELIRRNIVLEVCPTVGWLIGSFKERDKHPVINCIPQIPYVICTDNPTLNTSTQSNELYLAAQISGMELKPFLQSQLQLALQAAFTTNALSAV